jgi:hypothetical protein
MSVAFTGSQLKAYFESNPETPTLPHLVRYFNCVRENRYEIYNVHDFVMSRVGSWSSADKVIIDKAITWPGFT